MFQKFWENLTVFAMPAWQNNSNFNCCQNRFCTNQFLSQPYRDWPVKKIKRLFSNIRQFLTLPHLVLIFLLCFTLWIRVILFAFFSTLIFLFLLFLLFIFIQIIWVTATNAFAGGVWRGARITFTVAGTIYCFLSRFLKRNVLIIWITSFYRWHCN